MLQYSKLDSINSSLPKLQNISSFTQGSVLINDWLVGRSVSLNTIGEQSDSEFV